MIIVKAKQLDENIVTHVILDVQKKTFENVQR